MKLKIFAVYDTKAQTYGPPFTNERRGEALRGWQTVANDKESQIGKYPEDFCLFELGELNRENGIITPHETPQSLGLAVEYVKQ